MFSGPWIEKYRTDELEQLVLPDLIMKQLVKISKTDNPPNIIVTGTSGTGKTTAMICLAKKILGEKMESAFKELNSSDERGVKVVSDVVEAFCRKKIIGIKKKIILLDESDNMTKKQQQLISLILNDYSETTAFFFTCNTSVKIDEQIQSKCIIISFTRLEATEMRKILINICRGEKIEYDDDGLDSLIAISNGDMRNAINNLHAVYCNKKIITKKTVYYVCDVLDKDIICKLISFCLEKKFSAITLKIKEMTNNGYVVNDILQGLFECLKYDSIMNSENISLTEEQKIIFMNEISRTKIVCSFGIDTVQQLYACIIRIINKL